MSQSRLENEDSIHAELLIQYSHDEAASLLEKKYAGQPAKLFSPDASDIQIFYIMYGRIEQLKADFKKNPPKRNTPNVKLSIAVTHGHQDIVELLHNDYMIPFASPTFEAAWNEDISYFEKLKKMLDSPTLIEHVKAKLLQKDECGNQPVHYAFARGNVVVAAFAFEMMETLKAKNFSGIYDELAYLPLIALSSQQTQCLTVVMNEVVSEHANGSLKMPEGASTLAEYIYLLLANAIRFNGDSSDAILYLLNSIKNEAHRITWTNAFTAVAIKYDYLEIGKSIAKKDEFSEKWLTEALKIKQKNNPFYYQLVDISDKRELGENIAQLLEQEEKHLPTKYGNPADYYCAAQLAFLGKKPKLAREFYDKFTLTQPKNDWFELAAQTLTRKMFILFEKLNIETFASFSELYKDHFLELTDIKSSYFHIVFDALLFHSKVSMPLGGLKALWDDFNAIKIPDTVMSANESKKVSDHHRFIIEFTIFEIVKLIDDLAMSHFKDISCDDKLKNLRKSPTLERITELENIIVLYSIIENLYKIVSVFLGSVASKAIFNLKRTGTVCEIQIAVNLAKQDLQKREAVSIPQTNITKDTAGLINKDAKKEERRKEAEKNTSVRALAKQAANNASKAAKEERKKNNEALKKQQLDERRAEDQKKEEEKRVKAEAIAALEKQKSDEDLEKERLAKEARELRKTEKKERERAKKAEKTNARKTAEQAFFVTTDKEEKGVPSIETKTSATTTPESNSAVVAYRFATSSKPTTTDAVKVVIAVADVTQNLLGQDKNKKTRSVWSNLMQTAQTAVNVLFPKAKTPASVVRSSTPMLVKQLTQLTTAPSVLALPPAELLAAPPFFIPRPVALAGAIQSFARVHGIPDAIIGLLERFEGRIAISGSSALGIKLNMEHHGRWKIILLADDIEEVDQIFSNVIKKERKGFTHLFVDTDSTKMDIQVLPISLFKSFDEAMQVVSDHCLFTALCTYILVTQQGFRFVMKNNAEDDISEKTLKLTNENMPLNHFIEHPDEYIYLLHLQGKFKFDFSKSLNSYIDNLRVNEELFLHTFKLKNKDIVRAFSELANDLTFAVAHKIIEKNNLHKALLESGAFDEVELNYFGGEAERNSLAPLSFKKT